MGFKAAAQTVIVAGIVIACSVCAFREHQKPTLVTLWNDSRNLIPKGAMDETETRVYEPMPGYFYWPHPAGTNPKRMLDAWCGCGSGNYVAPQNAKKYGSTILHDNGDDTTDAFGWSNGANRTDELYGYMYDRLPAWRANWEPLLSVEPDLIYFVQNWNVDEQ